MQTSQRSMGFEELILFQFLRVEISLPQLKARYRYCCEASGPMSDMTEAIYIDESVWSHVTPGNGWSLKGVRPVGTFEKQHRIEHTLIVGLIPSLGIVHGKGQFG
jgi:hypothetical protein